MSSLDIILPRFYVVFAAEYDKYYYIVIFRKVNAFIHFFAKTFHRKRKMDKKTSSGGSL